MSCRFYWGNLKANIFKFDLQKESCMDYIGKFPKRFNYRGCLFRRKRRKSP